jgi:O-antigen/teichoic acid export membrane protein
MKEKFLKALQDKDFAELFKKGGVSFLMRVGGQIMGFLLTLIIARYFGANGLGDYVLSIIVLRVFVMIAKLGMDTASIKVIASFATQNKWQSIKHYRRQVISVLTVTSIIASIVLYFFSEPVAELIGAKSSYIRLNAFFILPMSFFILNYQSLRGLKKIGDYSFFYWMSRATLSAIILLIIIQFTQTINIPSISILGSTIFSGVNIDLPIFSFLSSLFLVSVLAYITFSLRLNVEQKKKEENGILHKMPIKSILFLSFPLMLAQSGQFIMAWADRLMLGGMTYDTLGGTSSHDVGIYDVAFKLSMFVNIALTSVTSISAPKFAELYATKNFERLEKVVHQSTKLIFWSTVPLLVVFFSFSTQVFSAFGDDFKKGIFCFIILCSARMVSAFTGPAATLLQMTGRQLIFMKVLSAGAVINIVINYLLIPIYGIQGAAIATMSSVIFWNVTMVYFVKKEFGFLTIYNPFKTI